jgi:hypothetical protein
MDPTFPVENEAKAMWWPYSVLRHPVLRDSASAPFSVASSSCFLFLYTQLLVRSSTTSLWGILNSS